MRFIHTADWHVGRSFGFLRDETAPLLRAARLDAITTIGRLAREHRAPLVLVAGDVFDDHDLGAHTLRQPLERMHAWPDVSWHLIPGNHDAVRPQGVWDRVARLGLPPNVRVHLVPEPAPVMSGLWLLPAPGGAPAGDPTAWMDRAPTPPDGLRVGLAHGPARSFGSASAPRAVIDPLRPARAGLAYLALGDWHGLRQEGPACWYSGTPEPLQFDQPEAGSVLLVEIGAGEAPLRVTPLASATFRWAVEEAVVDGAAAIEALEARLRARQATGELERLLLHLEVRGSLSLAERGAFERLISEPFASALAYLRIDLSGLLDAPGEDDLDAIAGGGALRLAAERLRARALDPADPGRELARAALLLLYRERRAGS